MAVRKYLFWAGGLLAAGAIFAAVGFPGEPKYRGRDLRYWSAQLAATTRSDSPLFHSTVAHEEAARAIVSMGHKAIPFALEKLEYRRSSLHSKISSFLRRIGLGTAQPTEEILARTEGIAIFYLLGESAGDAAPALCRLANDQDHSLDAARALTCIGPKGMNALDCLLTNQNGTIRGATILALISFMDRQSDPSATLERIILAIDDPVPKNQCLLSEWLRAKVEMFPRLPSKLVVLLRHPDPAIRASAAKALAVVNSSEEQVVASLTAKLRDPEPTVRRSTTNALLKIGVAPTFAPEGREGL